MHQFHVCADPHQRPRQARIDLGLSEYLPFGLLSYLKQTSIRYLKHAPDAGREWGEGQFSYARVLK